jgi:hypothetical protein
LANALPMPDEAPVTSAAFLLAVVETIVCSSLCDVSNPEALYAARLDLHRIHLFVSIETYRALFCAHSAAQGRAGNGAVRPGAEKSASWAHDV